MYTEEYEAQNGEIFTIIPAISGEMVLQFPSEYIAVLSKDVDGVHKWKSKEYTFEYNERNKALERLSSSGELLEKFEFFQLPFSFTAVN